MKVTDKLSHRVILLQYTNNHLRKGNKYELKSNTFL